MITFTKPARRKKRKLMKQIFIRNILWHAYTIVYSNNYGWQNATAKDKLVDLVPNIEDYGRFEKIIK
jgi:hypothetical protein